MNKASAAQSAAPVSIVRLHGQACFYCGAVYRALAPAGSITLPTRGGTRTWCIVACEDHRQQVRA